MAGKCKIAATCFGAHQQPPEAISAMSSPCQSMQPSCTSPRQEQQLRSDSSNKITEPASSPSPSLRRGFCCGPCACDLCLSFCPPCPAPSHARVPFPCPFPSPCLSPFPCPFPSPCLSPFPYPYPALCLCPSLFCASHPCCDCAPCSWTCPSPCRPPCPCGAPGSCCALGCAPAPSPAAVPGLPLV